MWYAALKNTSINYLFAGSFLTTNNTDYFQFFGYIGDDQSERIRSEPALCYASKTTTNSNTTTTWHTHNHTITLKPINTTAIHSEDCTNAMTRHASIIGIAIVTVVSSSSLHTNYHHSNTFLQPFHLAARSSNVRCGSGSFETTRM